MPEPRPTRQLNPEQPRSVQAGDWVELHSPFLTGVVTGRGVVTDIVDHPVTGQQVVAIQRFPNHHPEHHLLDFIQRTRPFPDQPHHEEEWESLYAIIIETLFELPPTAWAPEMIEYYFGGGRMSTEEIATCQRFYTASVQAELVAERRRRGDQLFYDTYRRYYLTNGIDSSQQRFRFHDYLIHSAARCMINSSERALPIPFNDLSYTPSEQEGLNTDSIGSQNQDRLLGALSDPVVLHEELVATVFRVTGGRGDDSRLLHIISDPVARIEHLSTFRFTDSDGDLCTIYLNTLGDRVARALRDAIAELPGSDAQIQSFLQAYADLVQSSILQVFGYGRGGRFTAFATNMDRVFEEIKTCPPDYLLEVLRSCLLTHPDSYYNKDRLARGQVAPNQLNPRALVDFFMNMIPQRYQTDQDAPDHSYTG